MSVTLNYPLSDRLRSEYSVPVWYQLPVFQTVFAQRSLRLLAILLVALAGFLLPTKAYASCTFTPSSSTTATSTLTSATISSASALTISGTWQCSENGTVKIAKYICLQTTFSGTTSSINGTSLSYTTYAEAGGATTASSAVSGTYYGPATTTATNNLISSSVTVTVPASTTYYPAGTYTATVSLYIDGQVNSGTVCEGSSGGGWDSGTQVLTFQWVVPNVCSLISTSEVNFGTISDIGTALSNHDADGAIVTKCNYGTPYTIYLGDGNNRISGSYRQMSYGSYLLPYQLYQDSAFTTVWDTTGGTTSTGGSGGVTSTGTGDNQTFVVYGRIPKGVTLPTTPGSYTDTVVVTVTY